MSEQALLTINQNATFTQSVQYLDSNGVAVNLTGFSVRFVVRSSYDSPTNLVDISSGVGGTGNITGISVVAATGTITIVIAKETTALYAAGEYVYDLKITSASGVATRILEGKVLVSRGVTP